MIERENKCEVLGCVYIECGVSSILARKRSPQRSWVSIVSTCCTQYFNSSKLHLKHGALLFSYHLLLKVGVRVERERERERERVKR